MSHRVNKVCWIISKTIECSNLAILCWLFMSVPCKDPSWQTNEISVLYFTSVALFLFCSIRTWFFFLYHFFSLPYFLCGFIISACVVFFSSLKRVYRGVLCKNSKATTLQVFFSVTFVIMLSHALWKRNKMMLDSNLRNQLNYSLYENAKYFALNIMQRQ